MSQSEAGRIERIKRAIGHPVIDADGHGLELMPLVREELVALAGESLAGDLDRVFEAQRMARSLPADTQRSLGLFRLSWWAFPTATEDRATAMLPALMAERLPELGIDFAVLYPTFGLMAPLMEDAALRTAACRAFNRFYAAAWADHRERVTPAAVIPMHTPEEALAELDHAVGTLGLRAVLLQGLVPRPLPGPNRDRAARWMDTFGPDDPTRYDAVWQRCSELGVAPTFHASTMGWGSRASLTNYMCNHIGNFGAAGEATCRSLFMAGVPHRFPRLRFAFLEGGAAWGASLYADLISHFGKRGGHAIRQLDPARLDREALARLFQRHGSPAFRRHADRLDETLRLMCDPTEDPAGLDEFRHSGVEEPEDIRRIFCEQIFLGCEADDPMNALAFDTRTNPLGARLRALFGSDIGHWDVPDMREVVPEAWEAVEEGRIDAADFRAFTFTNAVDLFAGADPDFFRGTAVESEVAGALGRSGPPPDTLRVGP